MAYAKDTRVSTEQTMTEMKRLLAKHGATAFIQGENLVDGHAYVEFMLSGRQIRIVMTMPSREEYRYTPNNRVRTGGGIESMWEQGCRQRYRQWLGIIKFKLEAVEIGITTLDREFLPDMVLPGGNRVEEWLAPQIEEAYQTGKMPPMLAAGNTGGER